MYDLPRLLQHNTVGQEIAQLLTPARLLLYVLLLSTLHQHLLPQTHTRLARQGNLCRLTSRLCERPACFACVASRH